jgi:hypothetical protein
MPMMRAIHPGRIEIKSEAEIRNPKQTPMTQIPSSKTALLAISHFGHSDIGISFGLRISAFGFTSGNLPKL